MFAVVTGGSGSGKSEFAENLLLRLDREAGSVFSGSRYYIATMYPFDEESHKRIARHRLMRKDKGFDTIECYVGLKSVIFPESPKGQRPSVLLECMSNLTANEFYREDGAGESAADAILEGIEALCRQCENVVVVTNEVFSDGIPYDPSTTDYQRLLAEVNRRMAEKADVFAEIVYSIPVIHKGAL